MNSRLLALLMRLIQQWLTMFIMFACAVAVAWTEQAASVNTAYITIHNNSVQAIRKALPDALAQVLVKMSGNSSIMTLPVIQKQLIHIHITDLLDYYSVLPLSTHQQASLWLLTVTFNRVAMEQLLQGAAQPIWSGHRPVTLIGLTVLGSENHMINAKEDRDSQTAAFKSAAIVRGVPIALPIIYPADDNNQLFKQLDRLPTEAQLLAMAQHYNVHSILSGIASKNHTDDTWQVHWIFLLNDNIRYWSNSANSIMSAIAAGVYRMADHMSDQLAVLHSRQQHRVWLIVHGIHRLVDYITVNKRIHQLSSVTELLLDRISDDSVRLNAMISGSMQSFIQTLKSMKLLTFFSISSSFNRNALDLWYQSPVLI